MSVFLLTFCWFTSVLGGELYSYHFEDPDQNVEHVYAPTAMALLSEIDKGVVFGRIDVHHNWAYVTTLGDDNKAEPLYHTLNEVRVINAAVAHPSPAKGGVVLVAGMARSDSNDFDNDLPFVGALQVLEASGGGMEYSWLMFEVTGELNMGQQMHAIEVFPDDDLNLFVAVGNLVSEEQVSGNGLLLAAFSLDDFSQLHSMNFVPTVSFENSGIPKAAVRLSTDQLLVAVGSHYLVRFQVSQSELSDVWCRNIESDPFPDRDIVGVHVLKQNTEETILVTGNKIIELRSHPFVKELDLYGLVLRSMFWDYSDTDNDMDQVYTSFLDTDDGILYLGGSHNEYQLTTALVVAWNAATNKLLKAGVWRSSQGGDVPGHGSEHFPKSVRAMVKADSGTLMFAIEAMIEFAPEAGLVTMTGTDCLEDVLENMVQYSDESNSSSVATQYLENAVYSISNASDYEIESRELSQAKVLCTEATTTTTSTKTPRTTTSPTTTRMTPTVATSQTTTSEDGGSGGNNGTTKDGFEVLAVALVIIGILIGIGIGYFLTHEKDDEHRSNDVSDDIHFGDGPTVAETMTTRKKKKPRKYVRVEEEADAEAEYSD